VGAFVSEQQPEEFRSYDGGEVTREPLSKLTEGHLAHVHELVDVAATADDLPKALSAVRLALAALGGLQQRLEEQLNTAETVENWTAKKGAGDALDVAADRYQEQMLGRGP
jgi:hypothetical protein